MDYTPDEIITISNATFDAKRYLTTAQDLLRDLRESFFMTSTLTGLRDEAKNNPGRLNSTVFAIDEFLSKGLAELEVFGADELTPNVRYILHDAKEKQDIINAYKGART